LAPVILNSPERPELAQEFARSVCRLDPRIAKQFARVTFHSDYRDQLKLSPIPSLILQCSDDAIAPLGVGHYMHAQMPQSSLMVMNARGHCPHMTAPAETIAAIRAFL
jgi:sigma-B regulation protein RsbQ